MHVNAILRRAVVVALSVALLASLPAAAARPVHDNGVVGLRPWHQLDLDTGTRRSCTPSPACGEQYDPPQLGGSDLRLYNDVKATVLMTVPADGTPAKIVRVGTTRPSYATCRDARQERLAYAVNKVGVWYCARTNSGRIARLKYLGIGTGVGGASTADFRWTTWVK